jgi:hypothetical protein
VTTLSRRRKIVFALVAATLVAGATLLVLAAADVYVHWRTQDVAGVNVWGYRGAPVGAKRDGERRIVMLGGSTAFGWGLPSHEAIPAYLEQRLNASGRGRYSVVNLGAPGQGAYGFAVDLEDYAYLDYDIVCLYEGYNDLTAVTMRGTSNYLLWRRESPVYRWTGYYPILPLVLREKADVMLGQGAAGDGRARFEPGATTRAAAGAMRAVSALTEQLGGRPGGLTATPANVAVDDQCIDAWQRYCGSVRAAIDWALTRDKMVLVVTQPYLTDAHVEQQANLAVMVRARYGADPRVRYLDLGRAIDMRDRAIAYDGLHLVARGNDTIAEHLAPAVLEMAAAR